MDCGDSKETARRQANLSGKRGHRLSWCHGEWGEDKDRVLMGLAREAYRVFPLKLVIK